MRCSVVRARRADTSAPSYRRRCQDRDDESRHRRRYGIRLTRARYVLTCPGSLPCSDSVIVITKRQRWLTWRAARLNPQCLNLGRLGRDLHGGDPSEARLRQDWHHLAGGADAPGGGARTGHLRDHRPQVPSMNARSLERECSLEIGGGGVPGAERLEAEPVL